jgi:hypothetical protein
MAPELNSWPAPPVKGAQFRDFLTHHALDRSNPRLGFLYSERALAFQGALDEFSADDSDPCDYIRRLRVRQRFASEGAKLVYDEIVLGVYYRYCPGD